MSLTLLSHAFAIEAIARVMFLFDWALFIETWQTWQHALRDDRHSRRARFTGARRI
jgi:hypothetical protein